MRRQDESESSICMQLLAWLYRAVLVLLMAAGLCLYSNLPLTAVEYGAALLAYLILLTVLHKIYQACSAGQVRVSELILSQTLSNLISAVILYLGVSLYMHRLFSVAALLAAVMAQELFGVVWSLLANHLYFRHYTPPRTVIVYSDDEVLQQLYETPYFQMKYNVCKLIRESTEDPHALISDLGDCEVIFAADVSDKLADELAKFCAAKDVKGFFIPRLGHIVMSGAQYMSMFSMPLLKVQRAGGNHGYRLVKRVFDVVVSLIGILVTLPIMLLTAMAIYAEDRGPVLYRQTRLTRNRREFSILKFRSMTVDAERDGIARLAGENDSRITKVGRFIRACRIDELPQLFNILLGDMSIVGPRPERPEIAQQYEQELPEFALRLQVKAGLTGMAQVYGRYNTEPAHKLQMDLMYINQMGLITDLKLIIATLKTLFVRESTAGVQEGRTTAINARIKGKHSA